MTGVQHARRSAEGRWETGQATVWWRLGPAPDDETPGAVARQWVEEIVRTHRLFSWRGFLAGPAFSKPRFATIAPADFSISHSGRTVLVGVAMGGQVGVDVETAPFVAFDSASLRARMLTPLERATLQTLPAEEADSYLARIWTAKEAHAKATGEGQRLDFRLLDVPVLLTARRQPLEACIAVISDGHRRLLRLALPAHLSFM